VFGQRSHAALDRKDSALSRLFTLRGEKIMQSAYIPQRSWRPA
jgi:hypothetical protein